MIILEIMSNPFPFIFCHFGVKIFPGKFECCIKQTRVETQIGQKMLYTENGVAKREVAHWMQSVYVHIDNIMQQF